MRGKSRRYALIVAITLTACGGEPTDTVAGQDLARMTAASDAYFEAWLTNDPEVVMATFVKEPVLSVPGGAVLEGARAARGFWWPEDAPPTRVTRFDHRQVEAAGSGNLGYVRGSFTLRFEFDGETLVNVGTYLHILRKTPDRGWVISHHFWNDLPQERTRQVPANRGGGSDPREPADG